MQACAGAQGQGAGEPLHAAPASPRQLAAA